MQVTGSVPDQSAEDVAKAALFFASGDSTYVTGAELLVDGGMAAGL